MTLKELDQEYVLHTYARNYTNFKSGKNGTLFDENGVDYIDFSSGIGVVSVGHGNARVASAIYEQAKNIIHISNLFVIEPQALLAQKLVSLSGFDARCFFANSGAEANEGAIKIARKYGEKENEPKRYKIITLEHSFHGRTITALKATGQEKMHNFFGPFPDGFTYAQTIEQAKELCDDHTIAVMIELVQGEGGISPQNKKEVQGLVEFLKERDILLIVDEVQTGVYRSGEIFASNLYDIVPDILTTAKGLAGGVPIGVIMTTLKDIFKAGDHGSTFGGNYLSTIAANEVLNILEEYKNSGKLDEIIIFFEEQLKIISQKFPSIVKSDVGLGLMRGLRIKDEDTLKNLISSAFEEKLLVLRSGRSTMRFLPPLTISKEEIIEGFLRLEKAFAKIL